MRLNRFLAAAGLGSRRSCDALIASGAVVINGHKIDQLATQVEDGDDVRVKGRPVRAALPVHILLNKPIGAMPQRHFLGGEGGVWAKKGVTLRGLRISEKKEILRKPTVL